MRNKKLFEAWRTEQGCPRHKGRSNRQRSQSTEEDTLSTQTHTHRKRKSTERDSTSKGNVYSLSAFKSHSKVCILLLYWLTPPAADLSYLPTEMLISLLSPELPYLIKVIFNIYPVLQHALYPSQFHGIWELNGTLHLLGKTWVSVERKPDPCKSPSNTYSTSFTIFSVASLFEIWNPSLAPSLLYIALAIFSSLCTVRACNK